MAWIPPDSSCYVSIGDRQWENRTANTKACRLTYVYVCVLFHTNAVLSFIFESDLRYSRDNGLWPQLFEKNVLARPLNSLPLAKRMKGRERSESAWMLDGAWWGFYEREKYTSLNRRWVGGLRSLYLLLFRVFKTALLNKLRNNVDEAKEGIRKCEGNLDKSFMFVIKMLKKEKRGMK